MPARQFFPGVIDYKGRISESYQSGRTLSADAAAAWTTIVAPFVRGRSKTRILDLGAGTGRFSVLFAEAFNVHVIGVEPSTAMLAAARGSTQSAHVALIAGSAEAIPLRDQSCDVAWLSHVWHHIADRHACVRELRRVVSPDGHVLMRGTFGDRLDGFPTLFRFWPAAKDICRQLPTVQDAVAAFAHGFTLREHRRVDQTTAVSLREFAGRTRFRADTALALIADSEFENGQAAIEAAAVAEDAPCPVVETIELLVFQID
jgi:ubiquinone/menaquinone biosynthesis C-methylase UbiE